MENGNRSHAIRLLSVLAPTLMLIALFIAPALRGEIFYRIGKMDPQGFYWGHCNNGDVYRTYWCGNRWHRADSTCPIAAHDFYYDTLAAVGFNMVQGMVLNGPNYSYLHSVYKYHGIKVWNANTHNVDVYSRSQCKPCDVGPPEDGAYFDTVCAVGEAEEDLTYGNGVFFCDESEMDTGAVICHNFLNTFDERIGDRAFYLKLRLRIDGDIQSGDTVLSVNFGPGAGTGCEDSDAEHYFQDWWWDDGDADPQTDNHDTTFYLITDSVGTTYSDVFFFHDSLAPASDRVHLRIRWFDTVDLYLDSVVIWDTQYQQFMIDQDPAIVQSIKSDAIAAFNDSTIHALLFGEPCFVQYNALRRVDDLCSDTSNGVIRLLSYTWPLSSDDWANFINIVDPPFLMIDRYRKTHHHQP